jgi:hypothetical protein
MLSMLNIAISLFCPHADGVSVGAVQPNFSNFDGVSTLARPRERVVADKVDFKKSLKQLYAPTKSKGFHVVDVPAMRFLMIDGKGDPNSAPEYRQAVEALYALAYALKFASKTQLDKDYVVPPLEGLWWAKDMNTFITREKSKWEWTMMMMIPEWIGPAMIDAGFAKVRAKKFVPALADVRVESYQEGRAVQILHVGSYDDEGAVLSALHNRYLPENGYVMTGKHHEIYLSDPRKVAPEKLKTVLRQPVK